MVRAEACMEVRSNSTTWQVGDCISLIRLSHMRHEALDYSFFLPISPLVGLTQCLLPQPAQLDRFKFV
jgi:hypothetical protein